ncbi:MAG: selenium-binding family protein [Actinomycetota bacterium]|nr:selenium-binding family protein [Actinomycetota bacterium]
MFTIAYSPGAKQYLIVPGFRSSRIHIVNVADYPRQPRIEKVIEPEELVQKTGTTSVPAAQERAVRSRSARAPAPAPARSIRSTAMSSSSPRP